MGLDGGRSIGMPKSSSERSSKSEFSDSEFVFGGLNLTVVLTWEMGMERGMGIWGDGDLGGGEGEMGGGGEGDLGGDGDLGGGEGDLGVDEDLGGGDCDVKGRGEGDLGVGIFAYFAK